MESDALAIFYVAHCPHGYNAIVMRGRAMHVVKEGAAPYPVVPCDRPTLNPTPATTTHA